MTRQENQENRPDAEREPQGYRVLVAGATGVAGRELLNQLEVRSFPVSELTVVASEHSAGTNVRFKGEGLVVKTFEEVDFRDFDLAFFATDADVSREWAPLAAEAGCEVIDMSSEFRMDPGVPLVVPEVNPDALGGSPQRS
ncbi:MAG: hypothetical protein Q8Q11_02750 [bacterium]|nr:hypothetical protein [bacterium]MDZ4247876.1 hypothetical protein [Patescibacteria group bacterium]